MRRILLRAARGALFGSGLLSPFAALGQTSVNSSEHPNYLNHSYRFKVVVPAGVTYTRTSPPNPDHGIGMAVGDQTMNNPLNSADPSGLFPGAEGAAP